MTLKKREIEILKAYAEILIPMFTRRIEELKEALYKAEPKDGEMIRGRAREMDRWRGIIKDLAEPPKIKKPETGI